MKTYIRIGLVGLIVIASAAALYYIFDAVHSGQTNAIQSRQAPPLKDSKDSELTSASITSTFEQGEGIIDPNSGGLFFSSTDLVVRAGPIRLEIRRYLIPSPRPRGVFGARWRLSYDCHLERVGSLAIIHEPLGDVLFTQETPNNSYTTESGEKLIVKNNQSVRTKRDGVQEIFDERGRLIERTDRNGNKIALQYDAENRLARVDGPYNTSLQFLFGRGECVSEIKSSDGSAVRYAYGATKETDNAAAVRYGYGADGALVRVEVPRTGSIDFSYDNRGRVLSRKWADGAQERFEYDDATHTVRHIDPAGRIVTTTWSADRRRAQISDSGGSKSEIQFDLAGRPVQITGPGGQVARLAYDALGRTVSVENPGTSPGLTRFEYLGKTPFVSSVTTGNGEKQTWEYDARQNLIRVNKKKDSCPTTFEYTPDGLVKTMTACGGVAITTEYDAAGRPKSVTDGTGRIWRSEHDGRGNLLRQTDPLGRITTRTYDWQNRVASVSDPGGGTTRFEYTAAGQLAKVINPVGLETRYEYDARGRVIAKTEPRERTTRYEFYADGQPKSITDAAGEITRYEYDQSGNLREMINALGGITTQTYDALGHVVKLTDSSGGSAQFEFLPTGQLKRFVDPAGKETAYEYSSDGRIAKCAQSGRESKYEYTSHGQIAKVIPLGGPPIAYAYDESGQVLRMVEGNQPVVRYTYDQLGNRVKEEYASGLEISNTFDVLGNLLSTKDNLGAGFKREHDNNGRLAAITDDTGATTRFRYDVAGNLLTVTDPLGSVKKLTYDKAGDLATVEEASGDQAQYEYDAAGRLAHVHQPGGGTTTITYPDKNVIEVTSPKGNSRKSTYDPSGRLTTVTDEKGKTTSFRNDPAGHLVEKRTADGKVVGYKYDARGNQIEVDDGTFPVRYTYDQRDRLVKLDYPVLKRSLRYQYNDLGNCTEFTDSEGGKVQYEYDAFQRLTSIRLGEAQTVRFTYDPKSRLTSMAYPNGVVGHQEYDSGGRMTRLAYSGPGGKAIAEWRYKYDAQGNCIEATNAQGAPTSYRYDPAGQLLEEGGANTVAYTYLPGGNRGKRVSGGTSTNYVYNKADQLIQAGEETFGYDANGNLSERRGPKGITQYSYDDEDRLVKVIQPDKSEVSFGYAPTGQRIWRKDASGLTYFVSDGVNLVAELTEDLKPKARYVHSFGVDRPLTMARDGKTYFYLADRLGSIARLTDEQGSVAAAYDYDAFGTLSTTTKISNPLTYTGREFEPASGQYYYRARYYDPALGRFLSHDPVAGSMTSPRSLNPYLYALNNPLKYVDPMGADITDLSRPWTFSDDPAVNEKHYPPQATFNVNGRQVEPNGSFQPSTGPEVYPNAFKAAGAPGAYGVGAHEDLHRIEAEVAARKIAGPDLSNIPMEQRNAIQQWYRGQQMGPNNFNPLEQRAYFEQMRTLLEQGLPPGHPEVQRTLQAYTAYGGKDPAAFAQSIVEYHDWLQAGNKRQPLPPTPNMDNWKSFIPDTMGKRGTGTGTPGSGVSPDVPLGGGAEGGGGWKSPFGKEPGKVTEFLQDNSGKITIVLSAAQLLSCRDLGKPLAECIQEQIEGAIKGAAVAGILGPQVTLALAGTAGWIATGIEGIQDWDDSQQRKDQVAARNAQQAIVEARLNSDIRAYAGRLGPLQEMKALIPPARAAAETQAQDSIKANQTANDQLELLQKDAKLCQEAYTNLEHGPEIKQQARSSAQQAQEQYGVLKQELDDADAKVNSISSDEEATQILDAWNSAQGRVKDIAAAADKAEAGNKTLKEAANSSTSTSEVLGRARNELTNITNAADAASTNIPPTKEKVDIADKLKSDLDDAVVALKKEIERVRGGYEETVERLFILRDEHTEKPEVNALFRALLTRVDAAAALPDWDDPGKAASAAALSAREKENTGKSLLDNLKAPEEPGDATPIDTLVQRAVEAKTQALLRLAASADLPSKVAAWKAEGKVPDVVTVVHKAGAARSEMNAAGFTDVSFAAANGPPPNKEAEGTVQSTAPVGGAKAKLHDPVTLFVYGRLEDGSTTPGESTLTGVDMEVPDVTGKPLKEAVGLLKANGIKPEYDFAAGAPGSAKQTGALIVSQQKPGPGKYQGIKGVVLTADEVVVPSVRDMKRDAAEGALRDIGLQPKANVLADTPTPETQDQVKTQEPVAHSRVKFGSPVTLDVYAKIGEPDTTAGNNPPTQTGGKWYRVKSAGSKGGPKIRLYWEVTGEETAQAIIPIPETYQASAQKILGVNNELTFVATRSGGGFTTDLQPLAKKIADYVMAEANKPHEPVEVGLFSLFGGGGGGDDAGPLSLVFEGMTAVLTTDGPNLRIRVKGKLTAGTSAGNQQAPIDAQLLCTPE